MTADGDTSRVDLREARICKRRASFIRAPDRGGIAVLGIGRKIEDIAIATCRQDNSIRYLGFDFASQQIARGYSSGAVINHDQIKHVHAWIHLDVARMYLAFQRLVRTQQ